MNRTQAKWLIENWDRVEGMRLSHDIALNVDERNKPMIEAFAAGKVVECSRLRADSTSWEASEDMKFIGSPDMYRIRPEEKYVPFEVADLMKLVDADVRVTDGKHVAIVGALLRLAAEHILGHRVMRVESLEDAVRRFNERIEAELAELGI